MKPLAAVADLARGHRPGITVLIYHRVGADTDGEVDLDVHLFADQMAALADAGNVVSLDAAVEILASGAELAEDLVVITFDDGTPDIVEHAMPILQANQLPMTLYLATGFVEDGRGFWSSSDKPLTWAAAGELVSTGLVTIGSHTHRHVLLDRIPAPEAVEELDRSRDLIRERLGVDAQHFAYPKALLPSAANDAAVRSRFASAAVAGTRPNLYGKTDVHLLNRSPIQRSDGMRWFHRKAAGGLGLEDRVRDMVNARRYADASS